MKLMSGERWAVVRCIFTSFYAELRGNRSLIGSTSAVIDMGTERQPLLPKYVSN